MIDSLEGTWLIQVGKDKGSYKTRYSFDYSPENDREIMRYFRGINVGNGYKKRLVAPCGTVVARVFS